MLPHPTRAIDCRFPAMLVLALVAPQIMGQQAKGPSRAELQNRIAVLNEKGPTGISTDEVLKGLREFYAKTARPDGSFTPGVDPEYRGMSDSAYSDLAAVTYAVTIHKTFGWKLPFEKKTIEFLLARQRPSGEFVNVAGTVSPKSAEGKTYNTTQALVALRALGVNRHLHRGL